jgi:hypothetical protein
MKNKDLRLILIIVLIVIILWILIKFISAIPFWVWILAAGIIAYLNWNKIKKLWK